MRYLIGDHYMLLCFQVVDWVSKVPRKLKMQQVTMTVDEQLIQKAIREDCPWESLPKRIQAIHSTKEEWHNRLD
ncbi:hypothetical protein K1719_019956 [Acacia pycnantha]|nr:hypothetical protein K1719_019956 [Acacia pycnantha]